MLGLFEAFSLKCTQLKRAVDAGDDDLVRLLDKELEPLISDILSFRAETREDAHKQLQFLNGLIRDESDDRSSVLRRSAAMSVLIDRYFLSSNELSTTAAQRDERPTANDLCEQPLLNEAILDGLPERVGVITTDYRYLYANQANASYLKRTPFSMIGCHVSEFIGEEGFQAQAKPAFDRCFSGEHIDYIHIGCLASKNFSTRCRMTPLRSANNNIIGAVIVLQVVDEVPALEHGFA